MPESNRFHPAWWRRGTAAVMISLLVVGLTSPPILLSLAFWAASDTWTFAGGGFRHWMFVKGSTLDRLGTVASVGGPVRYIVRLQEGTDPGEIAVAYDSAVLPADAVETYAERCVAMRLSIERRWVSPDATEAKLGCASNAAAGWVDDVRIFAERKRGAAITHVRVFAGPGLIATYNF